MTKNEAIRQVFSHHWTIHSEFGTSDEPVDDWAREELHALGVTDEEITAAYAEIGIPK